jgi:hypothetical protein
MASSHGHENEMLPSTWPFRAAGTVMIFATIWFCLGWALRDIGESLPSHMPIFWAGIAVVVALCAFGGIMNALREKARLRTLDHT